MSTRIHIPNQFKWVLPTHECLHYIGPPGEYQEKNTGVVIHHWPDALKPRPNDLPLLEMGVKEDPNSQRASFYLAREYYFRQKYSEAKVEFQRYLILSRWNSERSKAMRMLASIAMIENNRPEQLRWLSLATVEAPKEREAWVELAQFYHDDKDYLGGYHAAKQALSITQRTDFFTEAFAWGSLPYDLAGTCAYYIGLHDEFVSLTTQALQLDPTNERLRSNLKLFAHKVST
jgi:tetratricopeptide (TPR) repeat protein